MLLRWRGSEEKKDQIQEAFDEGRRVRCPELDNVLSPRYKSKAILKENSALRELSFCFYIEGFLSFRSSVVSGKHAHAFGYVPIRLVQRPIQHPSFHPPTRQGKLSGSIHPNPNAASRIPLSRILLHSG